ncbi:MAG: hypothetical protein WDO15_10150 [Bacteroidota bacterium]
MQAHLLTKHVFADATGSRPVGSLVELNGKLYVRHQAAEVISLVLFMNTISRMELTRRRSTSRVERLAVVHLGKWCWHKMEDVTEHYRVALEVVWRLYSNMTRLPIRVVAKSSIPISQTSYYPNVSLEQTGIASRRDQTITIDPIEDKLLGSSHIFRNRVGDFGSAGDVQCG